MNLSNLRRLLPRAAALLLCACALAGTRVALAQQQPAPMSNAEFLTLLRQLPQRPGLKEQLIEEIRKRGIAFPLTSGLRSFVATKSGNDEELRRVLEEAERRFLNPKETPTLPSDAEAADVLAKTREATLEAVDQMPDFVVKQLVKRSHALGRSQNWQVEDHLVVGVTYRVKEGEQYRLLAVNGMTNAAVTEKSNYKEAGGTSSTGEFVSILKGLFEPESKTTFKPFDTDTLRGRPTIVYEYDIKKENSKWLIEHGNAESVIAASRGKVWVDREKFRVLRVESEAYDIPRDFPVSATNVAVDYDWVTIQGQGDYLLPSHSVIVMTLNERGQVAQFRNDIRFRNYQKFGTELKIIEDDIVDDDAPAEKTQQQQKPPTPPEKKP
jgi:hypothetical protein